MRHCWIVPVVIVTAALAACGGEPARTAGAPSGGSTGDPATTPSGTTAPPRDTASGDTPQSTDPAGRGDLIAGHYQPLWPFESLAQAKRWLNEGRPGGHSPWHADAEATALAFTQGYLGFKGIDRALKRKIDRVHARITVGARGEGGKSRPAAVIHLMRYGSAKNAPWEVVGTDDTDLTLTKPRYGAQVTSPVAVGGKIVGVDESIRVQVRRPGEAKPVGEHCCVPAGGLGDGEPWSAKTAFKTGKGSVLTIVASTGGHIADVERFAVTGVRY